MKDEYRNGHIDTPYDTVERLDAYMDKQEYRDFLAMGDTSPEQIWPEEGEIVVLCEGIKGAERVQKYTNGKYVEIED